MVSRGQYRDDVVETRREGGKEVAAVMIVAVLYDAVQSSRRVSFSGIKL